MLGTGVAPCMGWVPAEKRDIRRCHQRGRTREIRWGHHRGVHRVSARGVHRDLIKDQLRIDKEKVHTNYPQIEALSDLYPNPAETLE